MNSHPPYKNIHLLKNFQIKHLLFLSAFCFGAALRFIAIYRNPITDQEALILLNMIKSTPEIHFSPLISVNAKVAVFIFGQSIFAARLSSALIGSLIILTPMLFEKYWGEKECITLSLLFAIDPFLISNAIQFHGNSFVLFLMLIAIITFIQNKFLLLIILLFMILISGDYSIPLFLLIGSIIYIKLFANKKEKRRITDVLREKRDLLTRQITTQRIYLLSFFSIASIVLIITRTAISSSLDPIFNALALINRNGNYRPGLNFVAFISYFPIGIFVLFNGIRQFSSPDIEWQKYLRILTLITFLLIALLPNYSTIDLSWASIPISFLLSKQLQSILQAVIKQRKEAFIWSSVVIMVAIYLLLIIFKYVSPFSTNNNILQGVFSISTALVFILIITFLMSYYEKYAFAKDILLASTVFIFLAFQLSVGWKSAGFGMNPEMEVLWTNGFFKDHLEINNTLSNAIEKKYGTVAKINVLNISATSPAFEWEVEKYRDRNIQYSMPNSNPPFIITASGISFNEKYENYLGQEFVVNEAPLWVNTPILSMISKDYWSWLIYRISPIKQDKNILWVSKEFFPDFIGRGDNK